MVKAVAARSPVSLWAEGKKPASDTLRRYVHQDGIGPLF